jgi:hypothetical protein
MNWHKHILIGLAMTFAVLNCTDASAQEIETLVMPGQVIEGHADIEPECSSCHKMFDRTAQPQLCMDCHEDISIDVGSSTGFHGIHPEASKDQCSSCHTEHEGRDAVVVILDENLFDHAFTDFDLSGAHLEAECADCHATDKKHREAPADCVNCHEEDLPHEETMGTDCATCHQPTEWLDAKFDHSTTDFLLVGKHQDAACLGCHEDRTFPTPPTTCVNCHAEDDAHDGRSGDDCASCHTPKGWNDTTFDHSRDTEFELLDSHAALSCGDCHSENPFEDQMETTCVSCHLEDDSHDGHNGDQCGTCHRSTSWQEPFFDHGRDTKYRLLGGHQEVACIDCHVEPVFELTPLTSCDSCHLDDDAHEESLGSRCGSCHTEVKWQDPVFFDHDLTRFPLLGIHNENECEDCHQTQAFGHAEGDCASCHLEDDPHNGNFHDRCDACHNPVAWDIWAFDHDLQTSFPLAGAHVNVVCEDCHRRSLDKMMSISSRCRDCHRADDIHDGEFGSDCGRCHTADSFTEVTSLQ